MTTGENTGRLLSLDALRGFDMMFIMGLSAIIANFCGLFPGGGDCWLATQMSHGDWEGFHHHDTIFALFLPFLVSQEDDERDEPLPTLP